MKSPQQLLSEMRAYAEKLYREIKSGKSPKFEIPKRTLSNVYYDEEKGIIKMGEAESIRYFLNVAHSRKFMQTTLVFSKIYEIIKNNEPTISKRQLYYALKHTIEGTKEVTFEDQKESDPIIEDMEVLFGTLREDFHIGAQSKGVLAGPMVVYDRVMGVEQDCAKMGTGGWAIPSIVEPERLEIKEVTADYVLVVEKESEWRVFNETRFWEKHNCLVVTGKGQADRGTRRLIHRLAYEFNLPIYVLTDADPAGYYIYSVIKRGSINLPYVSESIATPKARFLGLTVSDVDYFDIPRYVFNDLTDWDRKRLKEIRNYEWFRNKEWQRELDLMEKRGIKLELEALASKSFRFIAEEYVPHKLENKMFLP